jgi:flagellar operon protein
MTDNKIDSTSYLQQIASREQAAHNTQVSKQNAADFEKVLAEKLKADAPYGIKVSQHAQRRIAERKLDLDAQEFFKLRNAFETLKNKGGKDSLVITPKAAYIVDVDQRSIVTAMDKNDMAENVFTKIDSTLFIN